MKPKLALIALAINLFACGLQLCLLYANNRMRERIKGDIHTLETLSQQVQDRSRRLEVQSALLKQQTELLNRQTERLNQLRKLTPQPPRPDHKSKS